MVQDLRHAVRGADKASAKHRHATAGQAGIAALHTPTSVDQSGGGSPADAQASPKAVAVSTTRRGQGGLRLPNEQQHIFGEVQALPAGITKGVHGGEEVWHLPSGCQLGLGVVGILGGGQAGASHSDADAAGLEKAEEGLRNEEVKEGSQGGSPGARQLGRRGPRCDRSPWREPWC